MGGRRKVEDTLEIQSETPDDLFEAQRTYSAAQQELIDYVSKQIKAMEQHLLFGGQDQPGFYQLNLSLMSYESIHLGIVSLHQEARIEKDIAQEVYDDFYAVKFCEEKATQINLGRQAQFTAQREIEMLVRKKYMTELAKLKADIIAKENKYNFCNYLLESWKQYSFVLGQLNKNAQYEAIAAGVAYKNPLEFSDDQQ